jgi:hypothetical protein
VATLGIGDHQGHLDQPGTAQSRHHVTWVMGMKPNGVTGRFGLFTGQPVMSWLFQRFLHNLRRYTDERFATS